MNNKLNDIYAYKMIKIILDKDEFCKYNKRQVNKMRTTVTIDQDKLDELVKETKAKSKAKAVITAINEYLRRRKIEKIREYKGKLEFEIEASRIRHDER
jgi:hypothetical protein